MFDNVNRKDKVILTVSSPARMARSFVEFNQLYVLPTVRHVKGWWSVGFVYYGLSKDSTVTLKDGSKVRFNKSDITEESWNKLQEMRKSFYFILIGGWAIYVYTKMHKSKDIDIIVDYDVLRSLGSLGKVQKNA